MTNHEFRDIANTIRTKLEAQVRELVKKFVAAQGQDDEQPIEPDELARAKKGSAFGADVEATEAYEATIAFNELREHGHLRGCDLATFTEFFKEDIVRA